MKILTEHEQPKKAEETKPEVIPPAKPQIKMNAQLITVVLFILLAVVIAALAYFKNKDKK